MGLADFWRTMGGSPRRTGIKNRLWALLERWWDTTNTFHMAWGDITITPLEFAMITGLPFSERNVTFDCELTWRSAAAKDLLGPVVDLTDDDAHASVKVIVEAICGGGVSAEQRVRLFLLALVSRVMARSRNSRVHIKFLSALRDLGAVSSYNWGGLAYSHLLYEMKQASQTALGNDPSMAALWSVLEIWIYEHFPTLAPECTRDAAYPYVASWIGAVRVGASLAASRRAWRVLSAEDVVWRPFVNAVVPVSAARAHFLSGRRVLLPGVYRHMWYLGERVSLQHHSGDRLVPKDPLESMLALDEDLARLYAEARGEAVCRSWREFVHRKGSYDDFLRRLAPPVRFVLPEEEVDPEDIPRADRILRYENSDGEEVVETIPWAFPPHRKSYDDVPEHTPLRLGRECVAGCSCLILGRGSVSS
ncbi:protein MAIN-LIKE 2-like isoform X1 [Spinacia oleracea]|uniref:Protein MAIN-LIKE 2-like isoform X1 n=1 Tax=Spinacia oleracea TaxID=3562 RepID=A0ABM3QNY7_SPIOL|nr:protein MAIN-LIKE 2-like isoform X1 [Spinacia oleracea]